MDLYTKIVQAVQESGLWAEGREVSHHFVLSPEVLNISLDKVAELDRLAASLRDTLAGVAQFSVLAANSPNGISSFVPIFKTGPEIYHRFVHRDQSIPALCKVDMIIDQQGKWWIVEIDGTNKRALGYAVLERNLLKAVGVDASSFLPGVCEGISRILPPEDRSLLLIAPASEMYYRPGFFILQKGLEEVGVKLEIAAEKKSLQLLKEGRYRNVLDWPITRHEKLDAELRARYLNGDIHFLLPPKPYFGSKGILALVANHGQQRSLENTLRDCIPSDSLSLIRRYIPETFFADDSSGDLKKSYVLKKCFSSGMKGVLFSDDPLFAETLSSAQSQPFSFILQEEVLNQEHVLSYFSDEQTLQQASWQLRIIATFDLVHGRVLDLDVTACQDKHVHGSSGCLQFGAVVR